MYLKQATPERYVSRRRAQASAIADDGSDVPQYQKYGKFGKLLSSSRSEAELMYLFLIIRRSCDG